MLILYASVYNINRYIICHINLPFLVGVYVFKFIIRSFILIGFVIFIWLDVPWTKLFFFLVYLIDRRFDCIYFRRRRSPAPCWRRGALTLGTTSPWSTPQVSTSSPPSTVASTWAWCPSLSGRHTPRTCRQPSPPSGWLSTCQSPLSFSAQPRYNHYVFLIFFNWGEQTAKFPYRWCFTINSDSH